MYRRRSDLAKHFAPRQTPGRRGSTDQQTAAQRVLFQELQADTICWELFLRGQTCGGDPVLCTGCTSSRTPVATSLGRSGREGLGKDWADYSESVLPARDRSLRIRSAAALGLCLLAMPCLPAFPALPSLPCLPCLSSLRESALLLVPCTVCTATRLQAMSPVLAPFGPNSVATAKAPPHSQIRGQEPSPPSPPAMPSHFKPLQAPARAASQVPSILLSYAPSRPQPWRSCVYVVLFRSLVPKDMLGHAGHAGPCWTHAGTGRPPFPLRALS
jgi:hypothetical protein